jgi:hypothetical protein
MTVVSGAQAKPLSLRVRPIFTPEGDYVCATQPKGWWTRQVPALQSFIARDKFGVDNPELPIHFTAPSFENRFFGVVEKDVKRAVVQEHRVSMPGDDTCFINALGGEQVVTSSLAHVYSFLITANHDHFFIFYVLDENKTLVSLSAYWDEPVHDGQSPGWYLIPGSVQDDSWHPVGVRIIFFQPTEAVG